MKIPTEIVSSPAPANMTPHQVRAEFRQQLDDGARLICAGDAQQDPTSLLKGNLPTGKITLFGMDFYLSSPRPNPHLRFFVAYLAGPKASARSKQNIYPRIFYKDTSLIWRVASHLFLDGSQMWIGKGDSKIILEPRWEHEESNESTTDLPFEIQDAVESLNRRKSGSTSAAVLPRVLRRAPDDRIAAYDDFTKPRRTAAADSRNRIYRGRRVIRFAKKNDPTSLTVAPGFEPDYAGGLMEVSKHPSRFYGGDIFRFRVLSTNRIIQHLFFISPSHTWMIPPQALTTQLSSYGVRTVDVEVDQDAYLPGYEYHFYEPDDDGNAQLNSQIPDGYAGPANPLDETRVDASAWLDKIPMLREFRNFAQRYLN